MRWMKVPAAAKEWAGGVNPKTMYAAIRTGKLKAARIGSGRNVLVCEAFVDEWLTATARDAPKNLTVTRIALGSSAGRPP